MGIDFSSCLSAQPIQTGYHQTAREDSDCHRLQVSQALPEPAAGGEGGTTQRPPSPDLQPQRVSPGLFGPCLASFLDWLAC